MFNNQDFDAWYRGEDMDTNHGLVWIKANLVLVNLPSRNRLSVELLESCKGMTYPSMRFSVEIRTFAGKLLICSEPSFTSYFSRAMMTA
jgi:hypothetical protein